MEIVNLGNERIKSGVTWQVEAINSAYNEHVERTLNEEAGACLLRPTNDGYASSTVSQASVFFANTSEEEVGRVYFIQFVDFDKC